MGDQVAAPGRHTAIDPRIDARLAVVGQVVRWIAAGYALVGVVAAFSPAVRELQPGATQVRDQTATSAIALAILAIGALLAGGPFGSSPRSVVLRTAGVFTTAAAAGFGLFVALTLLGGWSESWPSWLDVPAFSVAIVLVFLGVAVPLCVSAVGSLVIAGQASSLLIFSLAAVIGLGFLYGDPSVGRFFDGPEMSPQATVGAVLTATGVFLLRPAKGVLSTASSPGAGGRLLRWLGPAMLLVPGLLILAAESVSPAERLDLLALVSVGLGVFLLILLSFFVDALDKTAIEASTRAAEAERAQIGLEQEAPVVRRLSAVMHLVSVTEIDGWDIGTRYRPGVGSVSGDASAVRPLAGGLIGAVLVDVTGHGAEPALLAVRARDLLIHSLSLGLSPGEALNSAQWSTAPNALASAIVVTLDTNRGKLLISSAGHPPALLIGAAEAEFVGANGPLLYLDPGTRYETIEHSMDRRSSLVLFSDGVADVQLEENGKTQPERLAELLSKHDQAAWKVAEGALGFADNDPDDDQTVVVIRRLG